jgi:transcriptional regulator with XRE-family HTH domain
MKNIAIGPLIKKQFELRRKHDRNFTIAYFADRINLHRSTVYQLFKQHSVDVYLLWEISKVLDYDFFAEIMKKDALPSAEVILGIKIDVKQLEKLNLPSDFLRLVEQSKRQ